MKKKKKEMSIEQIDRIINKGVKKEVDKETFYKNLSIGDCDTCIKSKNCKKGKIENWYDNCDEWEFFLSCKEIEEAKK